MSVAGSRLSPTGSNPKNTGELIHHLLLGGRPACLWSARAWVPPTDVYQTKDAVIVRMELAGVDPASIHIEARTGEVVVRGVRQDCHQGCKLRVAQMEIPYGPFERVIPMDFPISPRRAQARYQAGMLEIVLPRVTRARRINTLITIRLL